MHPLYPAIKPYQCHELTVRPSQILYLEETGNPKGIPVIILHSGPGAGSDPQLRRFFDPELYRIILFDQRGCGQSKPHCTLQDNTTSHLLDDIDAIRQFLSLQRFILFGGGWGSLLALLYAQAHPQYVSALLLHQIFLGSNQEVNWVYQKGTNFFYPDYWQEFSDFVPMLMRSNIPQYYAECLLGNNDLIRMAAAKNWAMWQLHCSTLQPHLSLIEQYSDPHFALTLATIETHYILNHYFIEDKQVLNSCSRIQSIPTYLIHGRQDMICPLKTAWDLHQALPLSQLRIVEAGHSLHEIGLIDAIIDVSKLLAHHGRDAS